MFVRVKVRGKFRCHQCKKGWKSNMAWLSFDMKSQEVSRMYGQKCNNCKNFYSKPFPFFYSEHHRKFDGTTPWRDIITKAVDLFVKKQAHSTDFNDREDDVAEDVEADENWNTVIEDRGDGPHDTELCQMCQYLRRPCVRQRKRN
eukprot:GFUD01094911.1.p1 GENE.GFUD01094911.1~~GFUD01094911.1.p1  ORF type:complete len:145 (+),score=45.49 GFUD01094911.1:164-598(+)